MTFWIKIPLTIHQNPFRTPPPPPFRSLFNWTEPGRTRGKKKQTDWKQIRRGLPSVLPSCYMVPVQPFRICLLISSCPFTRDMKFFCKPPDKEVLYCERPHQRLINSAVPPVPSRRATCPEPTRHPSRAAVPPRPEYRYCIDTVPIMYRYCTETVSILHRYGTNIVSIQYGYCIDSLSILYR